MPRSTVSLAHLAGRIPSPRSTCKFTAGWEEPAAEDKKARRTSPASCPESSVLQVTLCYIQNIMVSLVDTPRTSRVDDECWRARLFSSVMDITYFVNSSHTKQISIGYASEKRLELCVTISKGGETGISLTPMEWDKFAKQFHNNNNFFCTWDVSGPEETLELSGRITLIRTAFRGTMSLVFEEKGAAEEKPSKRVYLGLQSWLGLKEVFSCVNVAIKERKEWFPVIQHFYQCKIHEAMLELKQRGIKLPQLQEESIGIRVRAVIGTVFQYNPHESRYFQNMNQGFNINRFLMEMECVGSEFIAKDIAQMCVPPQYGVQENASSPVLEDYVDEEKCEYVSGSANKKFRAS